MAQAFMPAATPSDGFLDWLVDRSLEVFFHCLVVEHEFAVDFRSSFFGEYHLGDLPVHQVRQCLET